MCRRIASRAAAVLRAAILEDLDAAGESLIPAQGLEADGLTEVPLYGV
jgi:hypothetical protein